MKRSDLILPIHEFARRNLLPVETVMLWIGTGRLNVETGLHIASDGERKVNATHFGRMFDFDGSCPWHKKTIELRFEAVAVPAVKAEL
jgi:hypothetical protein